MLIVTVRTLIMYLTIIIAMRMMGKRQLGELQPSELVTTILISNLASLPIEETDISLVVGLIPIALIVSLEIIISIVELKSPLVSRIFSGNSKIIIKKGSVDQTVLNELRYSMSDLLAALRQNNVFDIKEVSLGIVETNGKLSVYTADGENDKKLMIPILIDGNINNSGLEYIGKDADWLNDILTKMSIETKQVLLLESNEDGKTQLILKEKK